MNDLETKFNKVRERAQKWIEMPQLDELRQITHCQRRKQTRSILLSLWYKDNMMGSFYYYISEAKYEIIEVNGMKVLGNVAEIFDNWLMSMPTTSRAKQCKQGDLKS